MLMHDWQISIYNFLTYPWRRHKNWEKNCGCYFKATPTGWLGIYCEEHWLD